MQAQLISDKDWPFIWLKLDLVMELLSTVCELKFIFNLSCEEGSYLFQRCCVVPTSAITKEYVFDTMNDREDYFGQIPTHRQNF